MHHPVMVDDLDRTVLTRTLEAYDVLKGDAVDRFVWPMNESVAHLTFDPTTARLFALVPEGAFPDGAGTSDVLCHDGHGPEGCHGCSIVLTGVLSAGSSHVERLSAFLDRLCERMVGYEDRFIRSFDT